MSGYIQYSERLACLNLESLQTRRLMTIFLVILVLTHTRGHNYRYKLFKAVSWLIYTSIYFRTVLQKSGLLCLLQWQQLLDLMF